MCIRDSRYPFHSPLFGLWRSEIQNPVFLDSDGNVVYWFDGFQHQGRGPQTLAAYTAREIQFVSKQLNLTGRRRRLRPVELPDLAGTPAVRVLCTLEDERMRAYSAPTVEVVPISSAERLLLAWSSQQQTVDATQLKNWLAQVYPPGMMERTNPQTKEAFRSAAVVGTLTLSPAGTRGKYRLMMLTGTITLTAEGDDDFSYQGELEVLLAYSQENVEFLALRGVFEGIYPRWDRMHRRQRNIPLMAVFESIDTDS